jgi:hypothetical protein
MLKKAVKSSGGRISNHEAPAAHRRCVAAVLIRFSEA